MAMQMIEFDTMAIPSKARSGREPMDNPFRVVFPSDKKALTFVVPEGRDSVEARRVMRQVRAAARDCDRTGRIVMRDRVDGSVQFIIWTVKKIVRRR